MCLQHTKDAVAGGRGKAVRHAQSRHVGLHLHSAKQSQLRRCHASARRSVHGWYSTASTSYLHLEEISADLSIAHVIHEPVLKLVKRTEYIGNTVNTYSITRFR